MKRDEQVLFAFARACDTPDNIPVLTFLISEAAWAYAKDGLGHDFDLTRVGIPVKVIIGRTKNNAAGLELLRAANRIGEEVKDVRNVDLGFKDDDKKPN